MTVRASVVVVSYDMARELPRTLHTLSPANQRDIDPDDYEVVVVDNGSPDDTYLNALADMFPRLTIHRMTDAAPSPVAAVNRGLKLARGDLIGVFIDGARMASPRLIASALEAADLHPRPAVGTLAFHLGPDVQSTSVHAGYDQRTEDELLNTVAWRNDGYELFRISVFAASSAGGWFQVPQETNALFLKRDHWHEIGGLDPTFRAPGGGLANLDIWERLCGDESVEVIMLLGEGTFHQFHGGVATNALVHPWQEFHDEYVAIRGHDFLPPKRRPLLFGRFPESAWPSVLQSAGLIQVEDGR
ncbi:glycosyltransferase family 2 protein [Nocardioides sp.]|uniref:glycosyltransferase family 2 protein n=1 Tax=Nocardioides sp. TaxID=35761 RepID=UPI0025EE71FF|nr:glycosyltransferase family A protein [Nocardioides sp.]